MPRLGTSIPSWVARYIGIPFRDRGLARDGADCWGLARIVYLERFGIALPAMSYRSLRDRDAIAAELEVFRSGQIFVQVDRHQLELGDLAEFKVGELFHCGVMVSRERMLHAVRDSESCHESIDVPLWAPRLRGFWRYTGPVQLTGFTRPFHQGRLESAVPAGLSVLDCLHAAGVEVVQGLRVWLGDMEIPLDQWANVKPKPGRRLTIACSLSGSGGGGKDTLRIVASIAVVAAGIAAPYALAGLGVGGVTTAAGGLSLGGSLVGIGISLAGTLAVAALIPPPKPRLSEGSGIGAASPTISGARNDSRPYEPIWQVMGRHRIAPPYGARPYTEVVGDDQYLRLLFAWYGPCEISDLKIGETPIDEFEGVQVEVRNGFDDEPPITLYPDTIQEQGLSVLLEESALWVQRTSSNNTEELQVEITFPGGLTAFDAEANRINRTVEVYVQYREVGHADWSDINGNGDTAGSPSDFRGLDLLTRTPEAALGGTGIHANDLNWSGSQVPYPDAKPAYLPSGGYAWVAQGYVFIPTAGQYSFVIDGSDACDCHVDWREVASRYGSHDVAATQATLNTLTTSTGPITLTRGWHAFRARVESRSGGSGGGALAVGWKKPGDSVYTIIPQVHFSPSANTYSGGALSYAWYTNGAYGSTITTTDARTDTIRRTLSWAVPRAQYEVRMRRVTPDSTSSSIIDRVYWTALRSVSHADPIRMDGLAKVALRIKATNQLGDVVDTFNLVAHSIFPDWDETEQAWIARATSNPASIARGILQGRANARPLADARIKLARFQGLHERCTDLGLEYNGVFDTAGTVYERLNDVLSAGRATVGMEDGLYSVVVDQPQTVPTQHLTPRNTTSFKGSKVFPDEVHGLRVQFMSRELGWQRDEQIVLNDGYQLDGLDAFGDSHPEYPAATKFEVLELHGIDNWPQAFKAGRYYLAVLKLRPESYEVGMDIEALVARRGELVHFTHDVVKAGLASGRVTALIRDTDDRLLGIKLDETIVMVAGEEYCVRVRLDDGTSFFRQVITNEGEQTEIRFPGPVDAGVPRPQAGDLFMFGRSGSESRELVVKGMRLDKDLGAVLTLVDHAPAVHDSDTGKIPPYDPNIDQPPTWEDGPETPVIESIRSDDFVMVRDGDGSLRPRMVILLRRASGNRPVPVAAQVRTREKPEPPAEPQGPWTYHPVGAIADQQVSVNNVEEGVTYQIALRVIDAQGRASRWVYAEHTVVGKSAPPPDVQSFDVTRTSDGTRRYSWDLGPVPPDIAGVQIRFGAEYTTWNSMAPLHSGVLQATPSELNEPPAGTWKFGIKAIDTSGNLSLNALYVTKTLGPPRQEGIAFSEDAGIKGWPGTKTDCHTATIGGVLVLEANDRATWDTLASFGADTWDHWPRWILAPYSPIVYEHTPLDAGFVLDFTPDVLAAGEGDLTIEVAWSRDGSTWSAWTDIEVARQTTVTAQLLKARVSCHQNGTAVVPYITRMRVMMRAETVIHDIQDLDTATLDGGHRIEAGDVLLPVPAGMFRIIRGVSLSFNGMGPGWSWELVDRDTVLGPRVRLYNALDELSDALIDAQIRGIGSPHDEVASTRDIVLDDGASSDIILDDGASSDLLVDIGP